MDAIGITKEFNAAEAEKNALESGVATINSVREKYGLSDIKGKHGDALIKKAQLNSTY